MPTDKREGTVYLDTSVLLKSYVQEPASESFLTWMSKQRKPCISPLSVIELRCALSRRNRAKLIDDEQRSSALSEFHAELAAEQYALLAWPKTIFDTASTILDSVGNTPLRSLDALHLTVAHVHRCRGFVTADKAQAEAAGKLGFDVHTFFDIL